MNVRAVFIQNETRNKTFLDVLYPVWRFTHLYTYCVVFYARNAELTEIRILLQFFSYLFSKNHWALSIGGFHIAQMWTPGGEYLFLNLHLLMLSLFLREQRTAMACVDFTLCLLHSLTITVYVGECGEVICKCDCISCKELRYPQGVWCREFPVNTQMGCALWGHFPTEFLEWRVISDKHTGRRHAKPPKFPVFGVTEY